MAQRQWELGGNCDLTETYILVTATGIAIIQKAQYVREGPSPMISGVIVKSGEKFRLDPDPLCLYLYHCYVDFICFAIILIHTIINFS